MASTALPELTQYWSEDSARKTILYDCDRSPNKSGAEPQPYYRITYVSNLDMIHIIKYSPTSQRRKNQEREYEEDIVDEIDPSDIVGADLEVKFAHDSFLELQNSTSNVRALKTARHIAKQTEQPDCTTVAAKPFVVMCGDDSTNPDIITYKEHLERVKRDKYQNSAAFRQVGVYNRKHSPTEKQPEKLASFSDEFDPVDSKQSPTMLQTFFSRYSCSTDSTLDDTLRDTHGGRPYGSSSGSERGDSDDEDSKVDMDDATATTFRSALGPSHTPIHSQSVAYLNIYIYPPQEIQGSDVLGPRRAKHVRFQVAPTIDFLDARYIVRGIRILAQIEHYCKEEMELRQSESRRTVKGSNGTAIKKAPLKPPKYLVFINVLAGKKKSADAYEHTLRPMLEQSGVEHDLFVAQYPGHAYERMSALFAILATRTNMYDVDGASPDSDGGMATDLLDISAYDGIIVLGGDGTLFEILQGLRSRKKDRNDLMKRLKFGIVGCGRYNGLASSLLYASKEQNGVTEAAFMICRGQTSKIDLSLVHTRQKTYLSFSSFYWGMIADIHIESGLENFDGWKAMSVRTYRAKFSYLKAAYLKNIREIIQNFPPLEQETLDEKWITIEGNFIFLWASQLSHAVYNLMQSPKSKPADGLFRVMMVRDHCSRFTLAKILTSIRSGQQTAFKEVEYIDCVAYRLVPLSDGSNFVLDGEIIESGPIQACILPSALNAFYQPPP